MIDVVVPGVAGNPPQDREPTLDRLVDRREVRALEGWI